VSCLDENTVVDLLRGRTTGRPLAGAEEHLATCDDCAQLLADAAGTVSTGAASVPANDVGDPPAITTARASASEYAGGDAGFGTLAPGTALNDTYRVIRLIGRGGMGEVYEVAHARLSGRYAAKVLTSQIATTPEILSRFRREAQITSALRHPHIVQVVDFNWTSDGRPFLAMEYLEGVHLGRIIQIEGPLSLTRVLQIVAPIVSALGAVHRRAIIHRDLKPQNIVLVAGSQEAGEVVKLLDFGLSKRTGMNPTESLVVSQQSVLLGTPLYMAPEQARGGNDHIGSSADQFSLAAIIYEMLTRHAAFAGDSVPTVLYRIAHVEPEPMSTFVAGIPDPVERVVRRALSKSPIARFPSIGAFFEALRDATTASAPGSGDSLPRPVVLGAEAGATTEDAAAERRAARTQRRTQAVAGAAGMALAFGLFFILRGPRPVPVSSQVRQALAAPRAPLPPPSDRTPPPPPPPPTEDLPPTAEIHQESAIVGAIPGPRKARLVAGRAPAAARSNQVAPAGLQPPFGADSSANPAAPPDPPAPPPHEATEPPALHASPPPQPFPPAKVKPFTRL
jgi:eukaryotic-like serine/threonine-protein kinase